MNNEKELKKALNNLLACKVKQVDAPCSAETHLDTAIVILHELIRSDYEPEMQESKEVLQDAIEHLKLLNHAPLSHNNAVYPND